jgi:hypothetical protein
MDKEYDKRFIEFRTFPWGPASGYELKLNDISFHSCYITTEQIEWENLRNCENKIKLDITEGYVIKVKSKLLDCLNIINIENEYFNKVYTEIYKMNFEELIKESYAGEDGWQFEIKIGINNDLNEYYKKIGLWAPPCTKNKIISSKIKILIEYFENFKEKLNFKEWYKEILMKEYKIYKKKNRQK